MDAPFLFKFKNLSDSLLYIYSIFKQKPFKIARSIYFINIQTCPTAHPSCAHLHNLS